MNESLKILKFGAYALVLPLVATAAASAHQWMTADSVIAVLPRLTSTVHVNSQTQDPIRSHTIALDDNGDIQGRVSSINSKSKDMSGMSDVTVYFAQNGEIVKKGYTNNDGTFVINGLSEGVYSFIAKGEISFATCGVRIVRDDPQANSYLEITAVTPNLNPVRNVIRNQGVSVLATERQLSKPAHVVSRNRIELVDGTFHGRAYSLVTDELNVGTTAFLFQQSREVAAVAVARDGTFAIPNLQPGIYEIAIVGPNGVAATSVELVAPKKEEAETQAYTSLRQDGPDTFAIALTPQSDAALINRINDRDRDGAVVFDNPVEFVGESLGDGIAVGTGSGELRRLGFGLGGGNGRFGFLGGGRLLLPAIAAGIAIPLATSSASPSNTN